MFTLLYLLVPLIAFLYASVGFGGATGYLAVMSFFGIPPTVMASTALVLNILVADISFSSFYRAGHLRRDSLLPFLATSVPAAFIGGYSKITDQVYAILLYAVLTFVAIRLLFFSKHHNDDQSLRPLSPGWALAIGLVIGLLSGMLGIGGGHLLGAFPDHIVIKSVFWCGVLDSTGRLENFVESMVSSVHTFQGRFILWLDHLGYNFSHAATLYSCRIPRSLLRGFQALAKSVPVGAKFRNTPSACGGDRNFEDFASLLVG